MSSRPDWDKGLRIDGENFDQELREKAERVRQWMKEETNNRKTGKAKTGVTAIHLAYEYLENLESEEEEKKEELAKYYHRVDQIVEEIR